ncbi:MAG: hypothetical protein ABI782_10780, partial [Anaerolineaceae bacterium]
MEATGDDGEQRERRAIDGLDWRPPAPSALDSPPDVPAMPLVTEPRPHAPVDAGKPRTSLVIAVAAVAAVLGGLVSGGVVARFARTTDNSTESKQATVAGATLSVEQTSAIADV